MVVVFLIWFRAVTAEIMSVDILYSAYTPSGVMNQLPQSSQIETITFDFICIRIEDGDDSWQESCHSGIVFDISNDPGITQDVARFALAYQRVHFFLTQQVTFQSPWSFATKTRLTDYCQVIWNLMQHFQWDRSTISVQPSNLGDVLYDTLRVQQGYTNLSFIYAASEDRQSLLLQVSRLIKPTGAQIQIVAGDEETIAGYISAAEQKNIAGAGRAIVIAGCTVRSLEAKLEEKSTGLLLLTEEGTELAGSQEEYDIGIINTTIARLADVIITNDLGQQSSTTMILDKMVQKYYNEDQTPKASFKLMNSQNGVFKTVGSVTLDQTTITGIISFLGDQTTPPTITGASILYTQNTAMEPTGIPGAIYILNNIGYEIGTWEVNLNPTILANFQLQKQEVSVGQAIFNIDYARQGLQSLKGNSGVAIMLGQVSGMPSIFSLFEENDTQTVSQTTRFVSYLSSPSDYPRLNRLIYADRLLGLSYLNFLTFFGWKKCSYLFQDIEDLRETHRHFNESALYNGVDLVDDPELNGIPIDAGYDFFAQGRGKSLLDKIFASKAKIMFAILPISDTLFYLLEYLYDRGFRRDDFIFIMTFIQLQRFISFKETHPERYMKIDQFAYNSLYIFQPVFVDEKGTSFIGKSIGVFGSTPVPLSCLNYDSMFHLSYGLEFGINRGFDYEDGDILHGNMRQVRFTGCSGYISLDQNSNDRRLFQLSALQYFFNETSQAYSQDVVGTYSPISATLYSFPNQIVWPDGTTQVPSDSRALDSDCPFDEADLVTSHKGKEIIYSICFTILGLVTALSAYMFMKYIRIRIVQLTEKTSYAPSDLIIAATIPIEFFQYSSLGFDSDVLIGVYAVLGKVANSDMQQFIDIEEEVFQLLVYHCYGLIALWLVLISFQYLDVYKRCGFSMMEQTSYYLIPIVSNFFYIPIISILLSVFLCDETTGDDIDDAVLMKDCHVECWKDEHLIHSVVSGFCLLVFVPTVVYMRPFIQERNYDINVVTRPQFIIIKSVFQLLLIVISKTLLRFNEFDYALTYFFCLSAWTVLIYFIQPYNYERFNLWQVFVSCGNVRIALFIGLFGMVI